MTDPDHFPRVDSSLLAGLLRMAGLARGAPSEDDGERLARERLADLATEQARERYVLEEEIGRGGMGIVYRVRDTDLKRALAMKVVRRRGGADSDAHDPVMLARFLDEARVTGQLDHPGIVPLHEIGIDAHGCIYFTMRLVRGRHLADVFEVARKRVDGWSEERVVEALVKMCDAMAYAHAKGVVHRDLKPQNVMTGRFGEVYVMDWGVAKVLDQREGSTVSTVSEMTRSVIAGPADTKSGVTIAGAVFGTPAYMAPEQARGAIDELDARSDVYSIGAILYHWLAGHAPYTPPGVTTSVHTLLKWVIEGPPKALDELAPSAPAELRAICAKAMERDPRLRYRDATALRDDLRAWLAGRPVSVLKLSAAARTLRWCRRYPWIAALLVAVTCGASIGLWRLSSLGSALVVQAALDDAATKARMLETVNGLYSSAVAARVDRAHVEVTHDWQARAGAIPLPATFLTELAGRISEEGSTLVKHYSDLPFRFRGAPSLDEFGRRAMAALRVNPEQPVSEITTIDGRPVLRYAVARRMGESCVQCHNSHPDSPKQDWHVGEVRGVLEIVRPLDAEVERSRSGVRGALGVVAVLVITLTAVCAIALVAAARGERAASRS
ncbi:MAG: protein kinase domain-containing protein [Planctomycetota bacterium]